MVLEEKEKTAPVSSATTDVEQPLQKNTTAIIAKDFTICNQHPSEKEGEMTSENIAQRIAQLLDERPELYPRNDIGISKLFFKVFENKLVYVQEPKCWYLYKSSCWIKDDGNLLIMETIKEFVTAYVKYSLTVENDEITKFAIRLCSRAKRESIIKDACSIFLEVLVNLM